MPEFTVKEVRLPELHLPEIKRDDIVRSLSGVRLPEVDLAKARRASFKVPTVSITSSDVGKVLAAGTAIARFVRPAPAPRAWLPGPFGRRTRSPIVRIVQPRRRRSRWPLAVGAIAIVALGAWALLRRPGVRERVEAAARDTRVRIDELRNGGPTDLAVHDPNEVTTATDNAAFNEASAFTPEQGESDGGSMAPAFEETGTPA